MKDYILGVDLGGTNIKAAAYRLGSYEKVGEKRLPTQVEGGWEHVLGRVLAALEELLRHTPRERVLCVGMGVPGLPDIEGGVSPNFPQWEDVPVAAWLEERLLGPARRVVESHALAISRAGCEIVTAQLGDAAGMLGAAVYGARRMGEGARM